MDQPRSEGVFPKLREVCPERRGTDPTVTIASSTGVYCRCSNCGHVWHKDRLVLH